MQSNQIAPRKGLQLDGFNMQVPQEMVTMALNAVVDSVTGERINYACEPGVKEYVAFPEGFELVGHVDMERGEKAVFLVNGTTCQIGIVAAGKYTMKDESDDLGFSAMNPITGIYRLREGCQRVIFFQDKDTFDFYYNLDRPEDFQTDGVLDVRKLRLQNEITSPDVRASILKNGTVTKGQYRFVAEMLDADFNTIGYSISSNPVFVIDNSGIEVSFTNISSQVSFLRTYVVAYRGGSGTPATYQYGDEFPVNNASVTFQFDGVDPANDVASDLERFLLRPIIYDSSKAMVVVDNRLVRMGVKEKFVDYSSFQRSASKIRTYYKIKEEEPVKTRGAQLKRDTFPSLMGDEIYDVRIVYQFEGFESPAFHIPGPSSDQVECSSLAGSTGEIVISSCLKVRAAGNVVTNGTCYVVYSVTYTVDGGQPQYHTGVLYDGQDITIVCLDGEHDIQIIETVQQQEGTGCGDLEAFPYVDQTISNSAFADKEILTTWSSDMEFLGIMNQDDLDFLGGIERWKIYNTAIKMSADRGRTGYYEGITTYQNPYSCVSDYWGKDYCENDLAGMPIRYHRMPDRMLEPIFQNGKVRMIGLDFENIEYPHPEIIGHRFVIRRRTQKTILDKGFLVPMMDGEKGKVMCWLEHDQQEDDYACFFSPLTQKGKSLDAQYFKLETLNSESDRKLFEEQYNSTISNKDIYIGSRTMYMDQLSEPDNTNISIEGELMLQPGHVFKSLEGEDVSNLSFSNFAHANKLSIPIQGIHMASAKVWRNDIYSDIFSGDYLPIHTDLKALDSDQSCYDGDTFVTHFRVNNIILRRIEGGIWDDILVVYAIAIGTAITILTAGAAAAGVGAGIAAIIGAGVLTASGIGAIIGAAIGISASIIKATMDLIRQGAFEGDYLSKDDDDFSAPFQGGTGFTYYANEFIENLYVESDSNYAASRMEFEIEGGVIFKGEADVKEDVIDFLYGRIAYYDKEEDRHMPRAIVVPEIYEYNPDFFYRSESLRIYIPLPVTIDFCSACANDHPNWIIWSNPAFTDSVSDGMRTFLSENYISLGEHTGAITAGYYDGRGVWVRTKQSMWRMAPNPQAIKTDASEVYLGTGSFLGVPADQISPVNYGYAGGQGRYDCVATEFGWVTLDVQAGRLFLVTPGDGLKELGAETGGMWMRKNMPLQLPAAFYALHEEDYRIQDSTIHDRGIGVRLWYDPMFKRVFIHKKDYGIIDRSMRPERGVFRNRFTDQDKFSTKSFVLSYGIKEGSWISFHSYMPRWSWIDERGHMLCNGNKVWEVDEVKHGMFFGEQFPFIIELSHIQDGNYILDVIDYHAQVSQWNEEEQQWVERYDKSFDKMWIYNEWGSTKELALIFKDKAIDPWTGWRYSFDELTLDRSSDNYRVAGFKDISIGQPVSSSAWSKIAPYFLASGNGYIDKVLNVEAINAEPTQWDLKDLMGQYHRIRLFFSNPDADKMVCHIFQTILRAKQI